MRTTRVTLQLFFVGLALGMCFLDFLFENTSSPRFQEHKFYLQLSRETPEDTELLMVTAIDQDINDTVWYSLDTCPLSEYFKINETTGALSTNQSLVNLTASTTHCVIRARDRFDCDDFICRTDRATVVINFFPFFTPEDMPKHKQAPRTGGGRKWWGGGHRTHDKYNESDYMTPSKSYDSDIMKPGKFVDSGYKTPDKTDESGEEDHEKFSPRSRIRTLTRKLVEPENGKHNYKTADRYI